MTNHHLKGREAPKAKRSAMETLIFRAKRSDLGKFHRFSARPDNNGKVLEASEEMGETAGLSRRSDPGTIGTDKTIYLVMGSIEWRRLS